MPFNRSVAVILLAALGIVAFVSATPAGQRAKGRRDVFGAERAGQVEELLKYLFPGTTVEWDPVLGIRDKSGTLTSVDLGNFTAMRQSDGTVSGAAAVEVGTAKSEYLKKLGKMEQPSAQAFTTTIVAFREDSSGRISDLKKVALDSGDPLTNVNWFEVQNWPAGGWPILHIRYTSYIPARTSLTTIEWDGLLDIAAGAFLSRIPSGIFVKNSAGEEAGDVLSARRTTPTQIQIVGLQTKKAIIYPCSDPCVVDSPTLLSQWSQ